MFKENRSSISRKPDEGHTLQIGTECMEDEWKTGEGHWMVIREAMVHGSETCRRYSSLLLPCSFILGCCIQTGVLNGIAKKEIELYEAVPVAWAIANSGQYPVRLFEEIARQISSVHGHLNLQHCTNTLWAMAVCGHHPGHHFLCTLANLASDLIESDPTSVIPQAISDLVASCFFLWK